MILFGALENRAMYLDLGLIITLLGFIGTVLISKYIKGNYNGYMGNYNADTYYNRNIFYLCRSGWNT